MVKRVIMACYVTVVASGTAVELGFNPISTVVASASVIDWQSCSNHQSDFIWKAGGRINLNIFQLNATNDLQD